MKIRSLTCLVAGLAMMSGVALAEPFNMTKATAGYLYFNMPGADMARHDGELKNCIYNWAGGINPEPDPFNGPAGTGVIGAAVSGVMLSGWEAARKNINIEHCMVAKGWRLVRLAPEEGEKLVQLPQRDLVSALAPYIAADQPKGEIVRVWKNEEIYQSTVIARSPENAKRHLLGVAAMSPDNPMLDGITSIDATARKQASDARIKRSLRTMKISDAPVPGPGQALLVYSIRTMKKKKHPITWLERADSKDPMSVNVFGIYGDNDYVTQADGSLLVDRAILVPAGTWYVQGGHINMDNCLGAPFFEAGDGTSIYLGTFDVTGDQLSVSTDMITINKILAGSPIKPTPAKWVNGYTYPCHQMSMYALEFEGFPFAPDYHWGSRAHAVQ